MPTYNVVIGGQNGGGGSLRQNGGWLFAPASVSEKPFLDGPLEGWEDIFLANCPAVAGAKFPPGGWDPLLKAGVIAGQFAALTDALRPVKDGDKEYPAITDPGPPPDESDPTKLVEDLKKLKIWANGDREAENLDPPTQDEEMSAISKPNQGAIEAQSLGINEYYARLLACSPEFRPNTFLLVLVGIQVGGLWAAFFKNKYMRARPGQAYPYLNPTIPTPRHPSYPSGHAMQAFLISKLLGEAITGQDDTTPMKPVLDALANSIARNREFARVHYESDTKASRDMVPKVHSQLITLPEVKTLIAAVKAEFSGIVGVGLIP